MPWSDDARVMAHPFRAYAELATASDEGPHARALAIRVAFFLLVFGGFVSLITAGRLVAFHVVSTMVFWSFVPAAQAAAFAVALRLGAPRDRRPPLAPSLTLYFTGHGPWLLFVLAIAGVCLFAPDVSGALGWLLARGVLPALFLSTIAWSGVLTFACFRAGVGMPRARAARATAVFYVVFSAIIVGYYLSMNQIQPQLPWAPVTMGPQAAPSPGPAERAT
jgi:hypothetical protein